MIRIRHLQLQFASYFKYLISIILKVFLGSKQLSQVILLVTVKSMDSCSIFGKPRFDQLVNIYLYFVMEIYIISYLKRRSYFHETLCSFKTDVMHMGIIFFKEEMVHMNFRIFISQNKCNFLPVLNKCQKVLRL